MLIYDIGANRGLFTDKCLSTFEDFKIIAVEANPELSNFLRLKFINNKKVTILNNLVSTKTDEDVEFHICSKANTISTASLDWINKSRFANKYIWNKHIKVKSISIDKMIEQYGNPDLIKIDVEGYELQVIKGLSKKQSEICFEWAEEEIPKINQICKHLEELGYRDFGYIFGDEYLKKPEIYTRWSESTFHQEVRGRKKKKWGMIWVK